MVSNNAPTLGFGQNEMAIATHCDPGAILTMAGRRAHVGIYGVSTKQITKEARNVEFRHGSAISRASN